jgi:hypothetical protein
MAIRTLRDSLSMDSLWEELVFTEARLLGDDHAKEFSPTMRQLMDRLERVRAGQLSAWREEIAAEAGVAEADDLLDDWVHALDVALLGILEQDTLSPRYRRYFSEAPSSIMRLRLESQIARIRAWADSLASEPERALQELGTRLRALIVRGNVALERRRRAAAARQDHRVRTIKPMISDINDTRRALFGTLTKKAVDLHLPRPWPNRFFRQAGRRAKAVGRPEAGQVAQT